MLIVFKKIFDVKFNHEYYSSGYADDLVITPTENCRQLMKNLGLLFKKNNKGFSVFYISDPEGGAVKPFNEKVMFSFIVESINPYFTLLSRLPIETEENGIYYFSNITSEGDYQQRLTKFGRVHEDDIVKLKPGNFVHKILSGNAKVIIEIKNQKGKLIKKDSVDINNGECEYFVDLAKYKPGLYELFVDGTSNLKFYSSNEIFKIKPFGIIEITREDLSEISYELLFIKQRTYWRYYVVSKYRQETTKDNLKLSVSKSIVEKYMKRDPDDFTIIDDKIEFKPGNQTTNSEGDNVISIIFTDMMPLQEEPITGIDLIINNNGSSYELNDLPNPSVKNISRSLVNGKPEGNKFYSDIYIYI
ncbi:MAG: hypothetical protein PVH88_02415 [Ignavibacteria bacterium]|jgi:hypothetical protein